MEDRHWPRGKGQGEYAAVRDKKDTAPHFPGLGHPKARLLRSPSPFQPYCGVGQGQFLATPLAIEHSRA
jgi:hypothetical protein